MNNLFSILNDDVSLLRLRQKWWDNSNDELSRVRSFSTYQKQLSGISYDKRTLQPVPKYKLWLYVRYS
ncbi:hypothetical protein FORC79_3460 [Salmonella enterica subsp. enterica serovar Typhimurium]|nr:hypothetical protein FORC79_3460 [Salmonella enterica subsp. enterica serovar Typhimurium]EFX48552.1 hypothetical protein SEE_03422 [Salmonella enterica subsp. enterica serovar Typhimurium str. TN061786]